MAFRPILTAKVRKTPEFSCLFHRVKRAVTSWRNSQYAMSKTAYHISLKGYVGGYDFDRSTDVSKANRRGKATDDRHLVKCNHPKSAVLCGQKNLTGYP